MWVKRELRCSKHINRLQCCNRHIQRTLGTVPQWICSIFTVCKREVISNEKSFRCTSWIRCYTTEYGFLKCKFCSENLCDYYVIKCWRRVLILDLKAREKTSTLIAISRETQRLGSSQPTAGHNKDARLWRHNKRLFFGEVAVSDSLRVDRVSVSVRKFYCFHIFTYSFAKML